ncbi:aldehyde dehydrogenase [Deinococcus alpinitundrae]|uniref:aldehyde dehydrogenase n=1 Tax=Deinococcus alpinitundrae TaxID=468913 RepID=UPI0013795665|nr:aldehyde dehydrogenase [Deinococcus alpinitundrae]
MTLPEYPLYIGGQFVPAQSGALVDTVNPYTGKAWARVPEAGAEDVNTAVRAARAALDDGPWGRLTGRQRSKLIHGLAQILERDADLLGEIETRDNGKLLREMQGQCRMLPEWYEYYAGAADKLHGETIPSDKPNYFIYTRREPVGVVAAIVPWNSPLLLLTWKLAPLLAAGCTVVVKPADQTPVSALEFARRVEEAGFPPGVFNVVTGGAAVGAALVAHPGVDKVAFTGSTEVGIKVGQAAMGHLAKVSLELGGKSPNIVFEDADLEAAANGVIAGIFAAGGQTCIAGSRLLVHDSIQDELVSRVVKRAQTIKLGDPLDPETEMGPVAFRAHLDNILRRCEAGEQEGATLVTGGRRASGGDLDAGFFVEPTIFTGVHSRMSLAAEEIFGPVLSVLTFRDETEAVHLANDSRYALAAGIWTRDVQRAHRAAHAIKAGTVWVNAYRAVSYNAPFGGFKHSGIGRENSLEAVHEYLDTKTVWLELSGATRDPFTIG